jgi:hypothetical protein
LTKLTGLTRKEQTAIREQALSEQRFRAKLDAMRSSGDERQIKAADELEKANLMLASQSPELAQGFRDMQSGAITTAAAQKALISTNGEILKSSRDLQNGLATAGEATTRIGVAGGKFAKDMNMSAQLGTFEDFAAKYAELKRLELFAAKSIDEKNKIVQAEQDKQTGTTTGADSMLGKYAKLLRDQQIAMTTLQQAMVNGFEIPIIGMVGMDPALKRVEESVSKAVVDAIADYIQATGIYPRKPRPPLSDSKGPVSLNEEQKVALDKAATNFASTEAARREAMAHLNKLAADAKTADEEYISLKEDQTASEEEAKQAAIKKLETARAVKKAQKEYNKLEKAARTAGEELQAAREGRAAKTEAPKEQEKAKENVPPAEDRTKVDNDADAKKSEIARARAELLSPIPELKLGGKTEFKDLVQEQKDAINHLLENKGGRPIMGQTPGSTQGKESWDKQLKKSPREQEALFEMINEQIRNERKKKLEELEKKEAAPTTVGRNNSATIGEGEDFALKYAELKQDEIYVQENFNEKIKKILDARDQMAGTAGTDRASINLASMLPNVPNTDGATAGLTINSDVATLNSKGMNVTLDNSSDVAKLIMEPVITQMETSQKDQSMARSNFEASIGDLKAEFSKQKATDELLLAAVQELIRIQKNGVSVNEKILAAQA